MSIAKLSDHRRVLRSRAAFFTLIALGIALSTAASFARDVSFSSDAAHPFAFGLFIGIDGYPQLDERSRLHSCVHDATAMENFFRSRFHVTQSVLLTEQAATRKGIGNACGNWCDESPRRGQSSMHCPWRIVNPFMS